MSGEIQTPFEPYPCSLGTVINDRDEFGDAVYFIALPSGDVKAVRANGTPSPEAVEADIANPPAPPVDQATIWAGVLAGVITDTVTSIPLKASVATRDTLSATLVMLREAETDGLLTPTTEQTIWDADNVARTMTVAELRGLILRYGFAWQTLHATYAP